MNRCTCSISNPDEHEEGCPMRPYFVANHESPAPSDDRPVDAVADESMENQSVGNGPLADDTFVAAFQVTIHGSRVVLTAPVVGLAAAVEVQFGADMDGVTGEAMKLVPRLPIKELANPLVALVTRPSLERLVRAARSIVGIAGNEGALRDGGPVMGELDAALEPFADIGDAS